MRIWPGFLRGRKKGRAMVIRKAVTGDIPDLMEVYPILYKENAAVMPYRFQCAGQDEDFLRGTIIGEDSDILVLETDGTLAGFSLLMEMDTSPYRCVVAHKYAYLMDLLVVPEYRRRGFGGALLEESVWWAKERGLDFVELNVLANNERAVRLYEKHGFTNTMKTMQHMV